MLLTPIMVAITEALNVMDVISTKKALRSYLYHENNPFFKSINEKGISKKSLAVKFSIPLVPLALSYKYPQVDIISTLLIGGANIIAGTVVARNLYFTWKGSREIKRVLSDKEFNKVLKKWK